MKRLAIPSKEAKVKIVGAIDSYDVARLQKVDFTTSVPTANVDEIGNNQHAGVSKDTPTITSTVSLMDTSIKTFATLTGVNRDAYPAVGVDIQNLGEVDLIVFIKDENTSAIVNTLTARKMQVRDFTFSYNVDQDSTEEYTFEGTDVRRFSNEITVDEFAASGASYTLSETPVQLNSGDYAISVIADGEYLDEVAAAPAAGEYSISGTTLTLGAAPSAQVIVIYQSNPAGTNWTYISDNTMPASIRGKDVIVEISANSVSRVQSLTINGSMNVSSVSELGSRDIVGRQRQVPDVTGTLNVLETDTELIDLLLNGSTSSGATEFEIGSACVASGVELVVKLQDPCVAPGTYLKSIRIPQVELEGDSHTYNVNDNAQTAYNWRSSTGECIVYSGEYV
jgi:hypothetical protein